MSKGGSCKSVARHRNSVEEKERTELEDVVPLDSWHLPAAFYHITVATFSLLIHCYSLNVIQNAGTVYHVGQAPEAMYQNDKIIFDSILRVVSNPSSVTGSSMEQ
jgi:hypothetical protein